MFTLINDEYTNILLATAPPIVTLVAPVKLEPLIYRSVPPFTGPEAGSSDAMIGATPVYVNIGAGVLVPPLVVTTIGFAILLVDDGDLAVMEVAVATTLLAAIPPMVTLAPLKFVPVIVNDVPPVIGPVLGVTLAIVGAATKVYALALVPTPPGVVTPTLCAPATPAGAKATMLVDEITEIFVAATPPTVTIVASDKFVPVMVMIVPAAIGPAAGLTLAIVGTP